MREEDVYHLQRQIKKLYREGTLSIDEATQALEELHYTPGDANALLTS